MPHSRLAQPGLGASPATDLQPLSLQAKSLAPAPINGQSQLVQGLLAPDRLDCRPRFGTVLLPRRGLRSS
jgi:hypothetical protein